MRLHFFRVNTKDKNQDKKIESLGDGNIFYNKDKGEIIIKDKSEDINNNEIVVQNVKPTEIFMVRKL